MSDLKWKCFDCGKENIENAKFCARCGHPKEEYKKWRCAKCETFLPYKMEKCMICNTTSKDSIDMWKIRTLEKSKIIEDDINVLKHKIEDDIDNKVCEAKRFHKSDTKREKPKESSLNKKLLICIYVLSTLLLVLIVFIILNEVVLASDSNYKEQACINVSSYEQVQKLNDYDMGDIYYDL